MMFVLRMAIRETRSSWQRLVFFFVCLAIGVGAIVTLRSVIQSVRGVVTGEARVLIAGDVVISTGRGWTEQDRALLASWLTPDRGVQATTASLETATMVRPADPGKAMARMVELRGVEAGFPLYGRVRLRGNQIYSHALLADRGALVRPELLTQLDLAVGDRADHRVADVHDSGRARRRARQPQRRIQSWSTCPDRSDGARAGRPAGIRQPCAASDHAAGGPGAPRCLHA